MSKIQILQAPEWVSIDQYSQTVSVLLSQAYQQDPTIIPHSIEEMREKFQYSLIALLSWEIIGHIAVTPASLSEYDGKNIGECGSIVVHPDRMWHGIASALLRESLDIFGHYSSLVGATVHSRMYHIFEKNGFSQDIFPPSYLAEWESYLAPRMTGWRPEFLSRARLYRYDF